MVEWIISIEKDAITLSMIVGERLPILSTYTFCFSRFESTSAGANCREKSLKCDSATSGSQGSPNESNKQVSNQNLLSGETRVAAALIRDDVLLSRINRYPWR